VVAPTVGVKIALGGGPSSCGGIVGFPVVEVAAMGWPQTRREATDGRPTHNQVAERGRRSVDGGAVVGWCAGGRIGENPPPGALGSQFPGLLCGDSAITGELTRLFVDPEQGAERHCDPYLDTDAGPATPGAATLGPGQAGFTDAGAGAEIARRSADQIH